MAMNYNNLTPAYDYKKQSTDMQAINQIAGGGMQPGAIPGQKIKARMPQFPQPGTPQFGMPQQPYKQLPGITRPGMTQPGMSPPPVQQPGIPRRPISDNPAYVEWENIASKINQGMYQTIDYGPDRLSPRASALASAYNKFWGARGYDMVDTRWKEGKNPFNRPEPQYKQLPGTPQPNYRMFQQ